MAVWDYDDQQGSKVVLSSDLVISDLALAAGAPISMGPAATFRE